MYSYEEIAETFKKAGLPAASDARGSDGWATFEWTTPSDRINFEYWHSDGEQTLSVVYGLNDVYEEIYQELDEVVQRLKELLDA